MNVANTILHPYKTLKRHTEDVKGASCANLKEAKPGVDLDEIPVQHHGFTAPPLSHSLEDSLQVHLLTVYLHRMVVPSSILSSLL